MAGVTISTQAMSGRAILRIAHDPSLNFVFACQTASQLARIPNSAHTVRERQELEVIITEKLAAIVCEITTFVSAAHTWAYDRYARDDLDVAFRSAGNIDSATDIASCKVLARELGDNPYLLAKKAIVLAESLRTIDASAEPVDAVGSAYGQETSRRKQASIDPAALRLTGLDVRCPPTRYREEWRAEQCELARGPRRAQGCRALNILTAEWPLRCELLHDERNLVVRRWFG